ncbi:MAG: NADH-quinone oxidoreductase subunit A [Thermoplasmatales archaeon]
MMSLTPEIAALALAVIIVPILIAILIATAHHYSPKIYGRYTAENYECGEVAVGDFMAPLPIQYFFFIMAFVVFDVDFVLLLPWAGSVKALGLGVFADVVIFIAVMLAGLFYASKKGYMRWSDVR